MIAITYIDFGGTEHTVQGEAGQSVMQTAVDNAVPGIDADCGGGCACATCHVMVAEDWRERGGATRRGGGLHAGHGARAPERLTAVLPDHPSTTRSTGWWCSCPNSRCKPRRT